MPGILRRTRAYLEFTLRPPGYFVDFLNFASDFAPDQLSDSGKLASFQNGAPNTLCFPWKFPETQSAGDHLFSFLFASENLGPQPKASFSARCSHCRSAERRSERVRRQAERWALRYRDNKDISLSAVVAYRKTIMARVCAQVLLVVSL